jgi:hypothetical protein
VRRPPWYWWLQLRDIVPVLLCVLILAGFAIGVTVATTHVLLAVLSHIRDAWNKPSG